MTDPRPAQGAAHASHDVFVIAAAADRGADPATRAAADAQVRDCPECAALFADLGAISSSLAALPRELPAPRDFRLTPDRAASLRRRGWRAAFDTLFRSPSLRPFGNALATLGFAGLLLTVGVPALVGGLGGSAAATAAPAAIPAFGQNEGAAGGASTAPDVVSGPGAMSTGGKSGGTPPSDASVGGAAGATAAPAASAANLSTATSGPARNSGEVGGATDQHGVAPSPRGPDPRSYASWLSLGALVVGIALLALARLGGRRSAG